MVFKIKHLLLKPLNLPLSNMGQPDFKQMLVLAVI